MCYPSREMIIIRIYILWGAYTELGLEPRISSVLRKRGNQLRHPALSMNYHFLLYVIFLLNIEFGRSCQHFPPRGPYPSTSQMIVIEMSYHVT